MDTKYYQEFLVLVEQKNYVNAATRLYISQSVLTKHIQKMEDELGAKLFVRTTHSMSLTEYGEILVPYARSILEKEAALSQEITHAISAHDHHLTIGSIDAVAAYGISELLSGFRAEHPEISMDLEYGTTDKLLKLVRERKADLAFARTMNDDGSDFFLEEDDEIASIPYRRDCLAVVLPKDHILSGNSSLRFEQIIHEKLMFLGKDKFPYRLVGQYAAAAHTVPNIVLNTSQPQMLIQFVAKELGLAIMLRPVALENAIDQVCIVPLETDRCFGMQVLYRNKHLSRECVRLLLDYITRFRDDRGYLEQVFL